VTTLSVVRLAAGQSCRSMSRENVPANCRAGWPKNPNALGTLETKDFPTRVAVLRADSSLDVSSGTAAGWASWLGRGIT
jgi:hypothetical protein